MAESTWKCPQCGNYVCGGLDECPRCGKRRVSSIYADFSTSGEYRKSKTTAWLLAFFLGATGAHRYYLGYKTQGIIQTCGLVSVIIGYSIEISAAIQESMGLALLALLFLLFGLVTSIWAFVDFIRILTGGLQPTYDGYKEDSPARVQVVPAQPAASMQAAPARTTQTDKLEKLERLAKLHEQGILTDEEFQQQKEKLLKDL